MGGIWSSSLKKGIKFQSLNHAKFVESILDEACSSSISAVGQIACGVINTSNKVKCPLLWEFWFYMPRKCKEFKTPHQQSAWPIGLERQVGKRGVVGSISGGDMYFHFEFLALLPVPHSSTEPMRIKLRMTFIQSNGDIDIDLIFFFLNVVVVCMTLRQL